MNKFTHLGRHYLGQPKISNKISLSGSILCCRQRGNSTPSLMELINDVGEIRPAKPTMKLKVVDKWLDVTLNFVKLKGGGTILMTDMHISIIEAEGQISPHYFSYDIVLADRKGKAAPI